MTAQPRKPAGAAAGDDPVLAEDLRWLAARRRTNLRPTLRLMAVPFMAYLLLTPTVHPWYALILLVFLLHARSALVACRIA